MSDDEKSGFAISLDCVYFPRHSRDPSLYFDLMVKHEGVFVSGKVTVAICVSPERVTCPQIVGATDVRNWMAVYGAVLNETGNPLETRIVKSAMEAALELFKPARKTICSAVSIDVAKEAKDDNTIYPFRIRYEVTAEDIEEHTACRRDEAGYLAVIGNTADTSELATHALMDKFSLNRGNKSANSNGDGL